MKRVLVIALSLTLVLGLGLALVMPTKAVTSGTCGDNLTWTLTDDGVLTISGTGEMDDYFEGGAPWYGYADGITSVVIETGVTSIGGEAFCDCTALTSVTVGSDVTKIGTQAFYGCTSLREIVVPDSVTDFGALIWNRCDNLECITLPYTGTNENALANILGTVSLKTVILSDACTEIADEAFKFWENLTTVVMGKNVRSIGDSAFYRCTGLTEIRIPQGVTDIGEYAFAQCTGLTEIVVPNSVERIGWCAFIDCENLTTITIPFVGGGTEENGQFYDIFGMKVPDHLRTVILLDGCTRIPYSAFNGCDKLETIVLPNGVVSIGASAFYNCTGLTSVNIPETVTQIGNQAFYYCSGLTGIVIPDSVVAIGAYAFCDCTGLETLTLGSGLQSIGNQAFSYCTSLTEIVIPDNVTSMGNHAFSDCTNLTNVTIGSGLADMATVESFVFANCSSLTTVVIREGVTAIPSYLFMGCTELKNITIPASMKHIGTAFEDCAKLEHILYMGSAHQWSQIAIDTQYNTANKYLLAAKRHDCCTGQEIVDGVCARCACASHQFADEVTEPTCTEQGYTTSTCTLCGEVCVKDYVPIRHTKGAGVVTDPTCTEKGYTTYTCALCDEQFQDDFVDPRHSYQKTVKEPTCEQAGYTYYYCSCGHNYKEDPVDALGHNYEDKVTAPTCTDEGYTFYQCTRCGDGGVKDQKPALEHDYKKEVTAPTCTGQGHTHYSCQRCGNEFDGDYVDPVGHQYQAVTTAPTCSEQGYTTYTCHCGHSYIDNYVNAVGHNTVNMVYDIGKESTCLTSGIMGHYKCETCGGLFLMVTADSIRQVTEAELVIPAHILFDYAQVDPTCTTAGVKAHKKCEGCIKYFIDGVEVTAADLVISATDHSHTAKVTDPTCTEMGYTTHTCHCGHSYTDNYVAAKGHTEVVDAAVAPTCTATGLTEGKHCSVCNAVLVAQNVVSATGHSYSQVVTAPTCTAQGYTTYTCHCGHSYTDNYVGAKGHTPGAAASCTTAQTCTVCNAELAPAKGHTEVIDAAVAPTCTATGLTEGKHCSACNAVLVAQKEVAATGHNYTSVVTAPTCTEKGYTTHTCTSCGASYTSDHKEALGHTDEDGNILCDTCSALLGEIKVELKPEFTEDAVSEELKDSGFDTVEKIEEEMQTQIQEELKLPDAEEPVELKETVLYDAVLMYKYEEGKLQEADKEHFPEDGKLTVTLPIPEGTDPLTHKYHVVHMFTTAEYGRNPGDVEIFTDLIARPDGNGGYYITFEVTGLSPMMVCVQERHFCKGEHSLTDWYVAVPSTSTEKGEQRRHCEECDYYEPKESNLLGDVNGDGQINTRDAKLIMQYELGLVDESKLDLLAADVNGDGAINTRDAKLIMQYELGIITQFDPKKRS